MVYFNGITSLLGAVVAIYLGLKTIQRYFKYYDKNLLLIAITGMTMMLPWLPGGINFITLIFIEYRIPIEIYLIIALAMSQIGTLCWMILFTNLIAKKRQKSIVLIFLIYLIIFEFIVITTTFREPLLLGEYGANLYVIYKPMTIALISIFFIVILSTSIIFCKGSLKASQPEIRLKGKLLLTSIIFVVIGSFIEAILAGSEFYVLLFIGRILLILSTIGFYGAFILPNWIRKIFLKENGSKKEEIG